MGFLLWPGRLVRSGGETHHRLHQHVHLDSGRSVLTALEAAGRAQSGNAPASWPDIFLAQGISAAERRALRSMLLQVGCLSGFCSACQHCAITVSQRQDGRAC